MKRLSMRSVRGWLTHEDIMKLEEAAIRPLKYKKVFSPKWRCESCDYTWLYKSMRCPVCSSSEVKQSN